MKTRLLFAALVLGCGGPAGAAGKATTADEAIAAIALPEPQLRDMLARVVFSTQTMGMAAYTLGIPRSCEAVRPAFQQAIVETLPRWRENLVRAYRAKVPSEVLARAVAASPAQGAAIVSPYLGTIAAMMQDDSEPLLKQATLQVLTSVLAIAAKENAAGVDGVKRMEEMKQARADGSLYCGLQRTEGN